MGGEQYFVDIYGDLRYESRDGFQASLSTNIFGDKVYKDNRGNRVKYSKTMWERVPGKDRPCFEDFLFSELIHKYCNRRNVNEVYEIDIFGDAQYRSNQGLSMTCLLYTSDRIIEVSFERGSNRITFSWYVSLQIPRTCTCTPCFAKTC